MGRKNAFYKIAYDVNKLVTLPLTSRFDIGTNAFEAEWDLLVVLDSLRPDALSEVAGEYDFIGDFDTIWSVGSATPEWVANTFTTDHMSEIEETVYLASHGGCQWIFEKDEFSIYDKAGSELIPLDIVEYLTDWDTVSSDDFLEFDKTWKYRNGNEYTGLTLPETLTDRAIQLGRSTDFGRMVIHYKQPHAPYTANAIEEGRDLEPYESDPWEYIQRTGPATKSGRRIWTRYDGGWTTSKHCSTTSMPTG